jgi:hypothetical protein
MPSYNPAKKNTQYIFYIFLRSQANSNIFQVNPTIASGDFKVSIDGGAFANLATLPVVTPAGGKAVKVTLSTSEMNGDNIAFYGSDVTGAEWADFAHNIQTTSQNFDGLDTAISLLSASDIALAVWTYENLPPTDPFAWGGTMEDILNFLGAMARNKQIITPTLQTLRNDADSADIAVSVVSGDETEVIRGEWT